MKTLLFSFLFLISVFSSNSLAQDVGAKIDALSAKIDQMNETIMSKLEEIGSKNSATSETAARASVNEIQALIASNQFEPAKTKIAEFQKKFAGTEYVNGIDRLKNEVDVVGKPIPPKWGIDKWYQFEKDVNLDSDKPTFIVFWEVWCPHCRNEVPKIVELKNTLGPKGVQFVGLTKLSRGTTEDELNKFLKENNVNYAIGKESGDLSTYFAVTGVPAAVFIKNKKVVWRGHPALATAENIQKWMN